jgi:hypothetical protein
MAAFIKLTVGTDAEVWVNMDSVSRVTKTDDDGATLLFREHFFTGDGIPFVPSIEVRQSPAEVMKRLERPGSDPDERRKGQAW